MPDFYDYQNDPRNVKKREKARLRRRQRIIRRAAFFTVTLIVIAFGVFSFFNTGKNKPSDTAVKPNATLNAQPPSVTSEPIQTFPVPSPTAKATPPAVTAPTTVSPSAAAVKASSTYKIKVSNAKQTVTVLDSNNQVVKSFICSTGLDGADTETPLGTYTVAERGESFFSQTYQQGAYYWTQFYGDYLFHSVPFDKNRVIETAEAAKLGTKASHGCVRLTIENAKWIYDNIPRGTTVVIE
jgi:lipoprotein-anchoring transpeptidase ErfK/SrfK